MMRLAYTTLACPTWSIEQIFDAAQRYGYEGVEMRLLDGEVITSSLPAAARQQVFAMSQRTGVPIVCVDTSISIASTDPTEQEAQLREGVGMLELAAAWEAPCIRVFAFTSADVTPTAAFNSAVDCFGRLAARGAELGVKVLLETHDPLATGAGVASMLNAIPNQTAGALWDTLHPCRMGETPETTLSFLSKRLYHVHIKDGQRPADGGPNWKLVLLGEGDVPIREMLRLLKANGYGGWLSVEWEKKWHPEIAEPEIALPQHSLRLREYLAAF